MSGTTSQLSHANIRPVRPKPAITSSRISRIPWRSHTSRTDAEVAVGRGDDPVGAGDGLEHDGRDGVGALVHQDLLEVRGTGAHRARVGVAGRAPVGVRVEHPHHARHRRFGAPAPRVAGEADRAGRRPVVGTVAGDDLRPPGDVAGEPHGVLDRRRPAGGEERRLEIARGDLGEERTELAAHVAAHRRPDVAEPVGLALDRLDEARVLVAEVEVDELRLEVEVALAGVVPEPAALAAGDRQRMDVRLGRPRRDRELAVRRGDPLRVVGAMASRPGNARASSWMVTTASISMVGLSRCGRSVRTGGVDGAEHLAIEVEATIAQRLVERVATPLGAAADRGDCRR